MQLLLVSHFDSAGEDRRLFSLPSATLRLVTSGAAASDALSRHMFDAIVITAPVEDCGVETLVEEAGRLASGTPVIVRNRFGTAAEAIRCMQLGVSQYFGQDTFGTAGESDKLVRFCNELRRSASEAPQEPWMRFLVGKSPAMKNVAEVIRLVASRKCNVLITGETGTGKEMAAKAIHAASARSGQRLIAVNCSALPENLLEAELFGHTKGAFTGAANMRVGRFEEANRSTLFLDEIADLPLGVQTKLLRTLQEREIQRLGSSESIRVDFRLVTACNASLPDKIGEGSFREDLYYRLNTVNLQLPALRERREDIPMLVEHFLSKVCAQEGISGKRIGEETMDRLALQHWPGNVRQLENAVEMAVALSGDREWLQPHDFRIAAPAQFRNVTPMPVGATADDATASAVSVPDAGLDYERVVNDFERNIIRQALERTNGNKKAAAEILRLKRTTLNAKLKSLEAVAS